jgi:hypothetical protein
MRGPNLELWKQSRVERKNSRFLKNKHNRVTMFRYRHVSTKGYSQKGVLTITERLRENLKYRPTSLFPVILRNTEELLRATYESYFPLNDSHEIITSLRLHTLSSKFSWGFLHIVSFNRACHI